MGCLYFTAIIGAFGVVTESLLDFELFSAEQRAGKQAGKPICAVFSLTACGCAVSGGGDAVRKRASEWLSEWVRQIERRKNNGANEENWKRFVLLSVIGGRVLSNLWRELCFLIKTHILCGCALTHTCAQVLFWLCALQCVLPWVHAQVHVCVFVWSVHAHRGPSPSAHLYGGE